jgi:imidazolonepropionase-like amidohydrolase
VNPFRTATVFVQMAFTAIFATVSAAGEPSSVIAIVGGTIVNPNSDVRNLQRDAVILINGDRIVHVSTAAEVSIPTDARIVSAYGKWIIPGLMDLHVHLSGDESLEGAYQGGLPQPAPQSERVLLPGTRLTAAELESRLRTLLRCGITTVRSMGEPYAPAGVRALRRAIAAAEHSPHVLLSSPILQPRSTNPTPMRVTTPEQAVDAVRAYQRAGVDVIKIWWADGRFTGEQDSATEWHSHVPIVAAMINESRKLGLPNSVDAIEVWKARKVIELGGQLAHGISIGNVDMDFIDAMRAGKPTHMVSTLIGPLRYYGALTGHLQYHEPEILLGNPRAIAQTLDLLHSDISALVIPKFGSPFDGMSLAQASQSKPFRAEFETTVNNQRALHAAGIRTGIGTDAAIPGVPFGPAIFTELALHLQADMTPLEILTAATLHNAEILGMQDQLGSITKGKIADLVLLDADPLANIFNLARVAGIVVRGQYLAAESLNNDTPEEVVLRLRNAFNAGLPDAFAALLDPAVRLELGSSEPPIVGRDAVTTYWKRDMNGKQHRQSLGLRQSSHGGVEQQERWSDGKQYTVTYLVSENRQIKNISINKRTP